MNKFYKTVFISSMSGVLATSLIIFITKKCIMSKAQKKMHGCSENCFEYYCDQNDTSDYVQSENKKGE